MSCFTCITVVDPEQKGEKAVTNSTKKVVILSTDGGEVPKEEREGIREGILKLRQVQLHMLGSLLKSWWSAIMFYYMRREIVDQQNHSHSNFVASAP